MKYLNQIDAQQVGSICFDSNTYLSIYDVFKMNNLIADISKNIAVKFSETEGCLIGIATCCGE